MDWKGIAGIAQIRRAGIVDRPDPDISGQLATPVMPQPVRDGEEVGIQRFLTQDALWKAGQQLMCSLLVAEACVND